MVLVLLAGAWVVVHWLVLAGAIGGNQNGARSNSWVLGFRVMGDDTLLLELQI